MLDLPSDKDIQHHWALQYSYAQSFLNYYLASQETLNVNTYQLTAMLQSNNMMYWLTECCGL